MNKEKHDWRHKLYVIIFKADTPAGKAFDLALLLAIFLSVMAVMLESIMQVKQDYGHLLRIAEWAFTIIFTLEYLARIITSQKPVRYITSFWGVIDLLAVIPTYLTLFITGSQYLLSIRALRLIRVFRILKLGRYIKEAEVLRKALMASRYKISVFLGSVVTLVIVLGTIMYLIEGPENGFTSIPKSIYWSIVTLTTVGYGDIAPQTVLGQALASIIMILGYSIIAVPTGIVSAELSDAKKYSDNTICNKCGKNDHRINSRFCYNCGNRIAG